MQLSQSIKKFIRALGQKKYRDEQKLFIAEGEKVIADIMRGGAIPRYVVYENSRDKTLKFSVATKQYECDAKEMQAISSMSTAPGVLAIFPQWGFDENILDQESPRWLITDGIKDPGNMGTLIRTAHWFGINAVIAINSKHDGIFR
jgi:RNA methyltransferase, TrmH family